MQAQRDPGPDADVLRAARMAVALLEGTDVIAYFKDRDSRLVAVTRACARINGRTVEEMIGLTDVDLTDPAHAAELRADEVRIMETGEPLVNKEEVDRLGNRPGTWVETSKFPWRDETGAIVGTFGYSQDVTRWEEAERRMAELADGLVEAHNRLMLAEEQLRAVLNGSSDAIARYDRDLRFRYINPAGERLKGRTSEELIGLTDRESGLPEQWLEIYEPALRSVLETGEPWEYDFPGDLSPAGERTWLHVTLSPDQHRADAVDGVLVSVRDITELKRAERELARRALQDALTGLPNRSVLQDRLEGIGPDGTAVLFIDIDHFKSVNDTHGHEVGDRVLVETASRIVDAVREDDLVCRLGGDEFVVICEGVTADEATELALRVVDRFHEPVRAGGVSVAVSVSIGVAQGEDVAALVERADRSMYQAKVAGRGRVAGGEEGDG
jgi:diguanylate cyclase (GGDEF)-like protein/PAS domain S-box-containing protein